jgi:hypothetical protein
MKLTDKLELHKYIDYSECDFPEINLEEKYCIAIGFPANKTKINDMNTVSEKGIYWTKEANIDEYTKNSMNRNKYLLLHFDPKKSFDANFKKHQYPKPTGMSGGGVFAVEKDLGEKSKTMLLGILTEYKAGSSRIMIAERTSDFFQILNSIISNE